MALNSFDTMVSDSHQRVHDARRCDNIIVIASIRLMKSASADLQPDHDKVMKLAGKSMQAMVYL